MKNKSNFLVTGSIWLIINIHQKRISPKLSEKGTMCRFYPSCSNYGINALVKHGFIRGWLKTANRIWRCRPSNYNPCVDYP